jgi:hypothetical protein
VRSDIHGFESALWRYKQIIAGFGENNRIALQFLDRLASLSLSTTKICKCTDYAIAPLLVIDFNLRNATRVDVERVVAQINRNPCYRGGPSKLRSWSS